MNKPTVISLRRAATLARFFAALERQYDIECRLGNHEDAKSIARIIGSLQSRIFGSDYYESPFSRPRE